MAKASSKPRPTDQEALCLIFLRRERAKEAMNEILHGFGHTLKMPTAFQMIEYLSNMCMCLEMMLKLLSGDWGTHDVGKMFEAVSGRPHPNPALMTSLRDAIMNQKYLLSPTGGIVEHIPALESLYDFLYRKLAENHEKFAVNVDVDLPDSFSQFLLAYVERFYKNESTRVPPGANTMATMEAHMGAYRAEVERVKRSLGTYLSNGHKLKMSHFNVRALI
jgi:hypothetical protein